MSHARRDDRTRARRRDALTTDARPVLEALVRIVAATPGDAAADDVHAARVSLRRLRAHLRTAGDAIDPTWAEAVRRDARRVGAALGQARDLDVLAQRCAEVTATADERHRVDDAALLAVLAARRRRAAADLARSLEGAEADALVLALRELAECGPPSPPTRKGAPIGERRQLRRAARRVVRRGDDATVDDDAALHRTRIAAKRLRYLAEITDAEGAGRAERLARQVQDGLGHLRDDVEGRRLLEELVHDGSCPPGAAFAAGRLWAVLQADADERRRSWARGWPRLRRQLGRVGR